MGFFIFPKTKKFFQVWVGEYTHTASSGGTFPMALTGMAVKDWKEALDFSTRKVKSF